MQQNLEYRVMTLVQTHVEHLLAVERLEASGASATAVDDARRVSDAMRDRLLAAAEWLDRTDPDAATFIRDSLAPEGLATLKNLHTQQPPPLPWHVA